MMHNPHQYECTRCTMNGKNCDHLPFEKMENVGIYAGVSIIVRCAEYKKKER